MAETTEREKPTCTPADAECLRSGCVIDGPHCAPGSGECYLAEMRTIAIIQATGRWPKRSCCKDMDADGLPATLTCDPACVHKLRA